MNAPPMRGERRYRIKDKRARNAQLLALHRERPDLSMAELGRRFGGLSRQRVQQILNRLQEHNE